VHGVQLDDVRMRNAGHYLSFLPQTVDLRLFYGVLFNDLDSID
jgi:hypothetical protein